MLFQEEVELYVFCFSSHQEAPHKLKPVWGLSVKSHWSVCLNSVPLCPLGVYFILCSEFESHVYPSLLIFLHAFLAVHT